MIRLMVEKSSTMRIFMFLSKYTSVNPESRPAHGLFASLMNEARKRSLMLLSQTGR
jgi:hypothetical protein